MTLIADFNGLTIEELETHYEKEDFEALLEISQALGQIGNQGKRRGMGDKLLRALWPTEDEFIQKTHWIQLKDGGVSLFKWNPTQRKLYKLIQEMKADNRPVRIIILKARQLGMSTWITSYHKEQIDFYSNKNAMTISYDDKSTGWLFQKVRDLHARTYFPRATTKSASDGLRYIDPWNSEYFVVTAGTKTAGRSVTVQYMHYSEVPMWENADPTEVLDSANQCVPLKPETCIFHESTAKGAQGEFYDLWNAAEAGTNDFEAFFAPWFWDADYVLDPPGGAGRFGRSMSPEEKDLLGKYNLTIEQMAWRRYTIRNQLRGSIPKFKQEYPSCAEEAFLSSGSPALNAEAVMALYDNCCDPLWVGDIYMTRPDMEATYE